MKLILSRKGFDSSAGGVANPIMPDGRLISLPIPDAHAPYRYNQIKGDAGHMGHLVKALTRGKMTGREKAHLDPDLNPASVTREPGWRPLFGQEGAAQGHLTNNGVTCGDLFLFFGWFRQTENTSQGLRFISKAPDQHILYGWFQIGSAVNLNMEKPADWMRDHPHCFGQRRGVNTLYVASERLVLPATETELPGAGLFEKVRADRILTAQGRSRRYWQLPGWFNPNGRLALSYHQKPEVWEPNEDGVLLKSAARGQEMVLDMTAYPQAQDWVLSLL